MTHEKYPFVQISAGQKANYYALCPFCKNPIQLIGIADRKPGRTPYGRHTGKSIDGFPDWNYSKYIRCGFADPGVRQDPTDEYENVEIDEEAVKLYSLTRDYFDVIAMMLSTKLGIRASERFWEKCINVFANSKGYCYPWLTASNLPYIFAYLGLSHQNPYRVLIKKDSGLYKAMDSYRHIILSEPDDNGYCEWNNNGKFLSLEFRLYGHKRKSIEGEYLQESIHFCLDDITSGRVKEIYETVITFDETEFSTWIGRVKNRQGWLLDIAKKNMPDIEANV